MFFGVFTAGQTEGVRDRGSGNTTIRDVHTLIEGLCEHDPEILLFHR